MPQISGVISREIMGKNREIKEEKVNKLAQGLKEATSIVLTDYKGLSVSKANELKKKLKELTADFTVVKNSLLSLAGKQSGFEIPEEQLKGPTAVLISRGDQIQPIKDLSTFIKDHGVPKIKFGFFDKEPLSSERLAEIAKIPGKEELLARVVGLINSPRATLVNVLSGNLRNFVYLLSEIQKSKGGVKP